MAGYVGDRKPRVSCRCFTTFAGHRVGGAFVNPDIVHFHGFGVGKLRQINILAVAQCQVQDHMERIVKRLGIGAHLVTDLLATPVVDKPIAAVARKQHIIDVPADFVLLPLYGVGVEIVPNIGWWLVSGATVLVPGPRVAVVLRAVYFVLGAGGGRSRNAGLEGFKNIQLATVRPAAIGAGIGWQHPDRRPDAHPLWYSGADLHAAIRPVGFAPGAEAGR